MADQDPEIQITTVNVDLDIQEILLAASNHDIRKLRQLIRDHEQEANPANVKDPETGTTPLHAAVAACEPEEKAVNGAVNGVVNGESATADGNEEVLKSGAETIRFLLQEGAIWNDLDSNDETPGCLARRLGLKELYEVMVDAGVRAEMLLNRLDGYEELSDGDEEEEGAEGNAQAEDTEVGAETEAPQLAETTETTESTHTDVTNSRYLSSNLTFEHDRLLDQDQNGVMMAWESDIMAKSAKKLLSSPGLRVLNIGHGMGIIDSVIQEQSPSKHHIIEAHRAVLSEMKRKG